VAETSFHSSALYLQTSSYFLDYLLMSTKEGSKLARTVHLLQTVAVNQLVPFPTPLRHEGACVCKSFQEKKDRQTDRQ